MQSTNNNDSKNLEEEKKDSKKTSNSKRKNGNGRRGSKSNKCSNSKGFKAPNDINDPSWYILNESVLQSTAAMTFGRPAGAIIKPGYDNADSSLLVSARQGVTPGVMSLRVAPVIGVSNADGISAIDQAANILYTRTRATVANNLPYTKSDQMMFIMAADSAYQMLAYMQRAYGAMAYFNSMNKYYPKALLAAMDLDYDDLLMHRNDLYTFIEVYARRLEAVFCPANMPIFARHYWLYQNIWADNVTDKSQLYVYTPAGFYLRQPVEQSDFESKLLFVEWTKELHMYDEIVSQAMQMLDALLLSDDLVRINGDLKATIGTGLVPNHIGIDYVPTIAYSPEVLSQIENSVITNVSGLEVTEDITNDKIVFAPVAENSDTSRSVRSAFLAFMGGSKFINFHTTNPTATQMVVSTRNCVYTSADGTVECCGTEIITGARMFYFTPSGAIGNTEYTSVLPTSNPNEGSVNRNTIVTILMNGMFDWAPIIHLFHCGDNATAGTYIYTWEGCTAEIDTWTMLSKDEFAQMNNIALLKLFGV